jgi:ABC-type cobalt transport system substrate-binding protein
MSLGMEEKIIIIIIIIIIIVVIIIIIITANEFSLGDISPYASIDKTNENIYT